MSCEYNPGPVFQSLDLRTFTSILSFPTVKSYLPLIIMADLGFAGLYVKLKDRDRPLQDRLKLIQFAWKSSEVFIPNKEQVLTDILCGLILNQKKNQVSEDDACKVWRCLSEVLHTRRVLDQPESQPLLVLRQYMPQLMADYLQKSEGIETKGVAAVLKCTQAVMSSPSLSSIYISKLETMVHLLSVLCQLMSGSGGQSNDQVVTLLDCTVDRYIKAVKTAPNQAQILKCCCDKFIPEFLPLWPSLIGLSAGKKLSNVFLATSCHKDHHKSYEEYLSTVTSTPGQVKLHKKAKGVDHLFSSLQLVAQQKSSASEALRQYIPVFYEGFVRANCHNNNKRVAHFLLVKFCQLVGMVTEDATPTLQEDASAGDVVGVICHLLQHVHTLELYEVQSDDTADGGQTQFYRKLVKFLLNNYSMTSDWYTCLSLLLQMNHNILEPSLQEILLTGWIPAQTEMSGAAAGARDVFLATLMTTYSKLRQISKLMSKILEALTVAPGNNTVPLTPQFLMSYGETIQSLPQGLLVDVWKMFISCLQDKFLSDTERNQGHFSDVCNLFHHYLLNVKVTDYSITALTLSAVEDLMVSMETSILSPLLQQHIDKQQVSHYPLLDILQLCFAWGEVMAMLALYKTYRASNLASEDVVSHQDLSLVHSYMDRKQWRAVHKIVKHSENASICYAWEMLCIQRARVMIMFKDKSDWPAIGSAVEDMFVLPSNISEDESQAMWSGNVQDITNDNKLVARWHLLASNMAAIQSILSPEYLKTIGFFLVQTGSSTTQHSDGSSTTQHSDGNINITLRSVTDKCMVSPWLLDSAALLGHIVTAVWERCSNSITGVVASPEKKKKRKKYDEMTTNFLSIQTALSNPATDWLSGISEETLAQIQTAGAKLSSLLSHQSREPIYITQQRLDMLLNLIKLLQTLPLEQIGSCDQIRCLTGLLSVMAMVKGDSDQSLSESSCQELWSLCLELCTVILETCGTAPVFQIIDLDSYLHWLQNIVQHSSQNPASFNRCFLLLEISVVCAVKDYQVLAKLPPLVNKLCAQMKEMDSPRWGIVLLSALLLQEVTRMLNRAYLNESKKATCSLVYNQLALTLLQLLPLLRKPSFGPLEGALVRAFTNMLAANFRGEKIKEEFIACMPVLIAWCEKCLNHSQGKGAMFNLMSSLYFLLTLARCHKLLESALTSQQKLFLWQMLVNVLRQTLSTCDMVLQTSNDINTGSTQVLDSQLKDTDSKMEIETSDKSSDLHTSSSDSDKQKHIENDSDQEMLKVDQDTVRSVQRISSLLSDVNSDLSVKHVLNKQCQYIDIQGTSGVSQEMVPSPAMIVALYKSLAFQGNLETEGVKVQLMLIQTVMATLLTSFPPEDFNTIVHGLVNDVNTVMLLQSPHKIQATLYIWRHLLRLEFSDEQTKVIRYAARNLMVNMQSVQSQLRCQDNQKTMLEVTLPVLHTQQQMLALGRKFLPPQSAMMALMSCVNTPLGGATYVPVFTALSDILDCLLMHHSQTVFQNIPAYIGCAKRLLLSVVEQSNQDTISHDPLVIKQLLGCAYQMERLFSLIASHKTDFSKVAVYVVADYVTAVQKVTLLPAIKRGLVPSVYKMLDLCDTYAVAQLHTILSHGVTEVFKVIYAEYTKFFKYSGKV